MEAFWNTLIAKTVSECGLGFGIVFLYAGYVSWQLAKTRAAWEAREQVIEKARETERNALLKIIADANSDANEVNMNLAAIFEKVEGMRLVMQAKRS